MVCGKIDAYSFNNDLAQIPLLALQRIDGSGISVNQSHLNELKYLNPKMEFSKLTGTGAGITGGYGATSWGIIDSTMTRGEWDDLGAKITDVMKILTEDLLNPHAAADPLVQFTSGDHDGTLLFIGKNIYAATWEHPQVQILNCCNPGSNAAISATVPILITNVNYRPGSGVFLDDVAPFDNAKAVVAIALGAVTAGNILDRAQTRPENKSIRQAIAYMPWGVRGAGYNVLRVMSGMGGLAYIKSKKSWKISPKDAGVPECKKVPNYSRSVVGDELSANLEKIRKKVDRIELQNRPPVNQPLAQYRFEMLKGIAANLAEMVAAGFSGDDNLVVTPGLGLPMSFIERIVELRTSLFNEEPTAYIVQQWDAKIESYRGQFGDAVDVLDRYHGGQVQLLIAIEQARYHLHRLDEVIFPDNPDTIDALQGAADRLSKITIMKGKLRYIGRPDFGVISRDLRYSYKTGRVKINGKKRILTMMKIKERGSKAVYVAFRPPPK